LPQESEKEQKYVKKHAFVKTTKAKEMEK